MNSLVKIALIAAVFTACKNQPAPNPAAPTAPDASAILKHKYWVSLPFNEALFASNITDTLSYLSCSELVLPWKSLLKVLRANHRRRVTTKQLVSCTLIHLRG